MRQKNIHILRLILTVSIIFSILSFNVDKPDKLKNYGSKRLFKQISKNYLEYKTLSIKSRIKIDFNNKKYNLKGNFRIKKDSIIWLNLNHASGISVLRAILTPDSIKYLDKINKKYYAGTYEMTAKALKINLNFNSLQSLLTNELISISDNRKPVKVFSDYKSLKDSNMYILQNIKNRKIKKYYKKNKCKFLLLEKIYITPCVFKINKFKVEDLKTNKKLTIDYNDFKKIDSTLFPQKIDFKVVEDSSKTVINMKYSQIKVNSKNKYNFKVPKRYEIFNVK